VRSRLPFLTFLTSCHAVLATRIHLRLSLEWAHARTLFHSERASLRTTSLSDRETLFLFLADRTDCFTRLFYLPRSEAGRLFHTWATTLFIYADTAAAPCRVASANFSLLANTLILHTVIIANQAKPHVPVDRVLNLHNGRDMAAGPRRSATLLLSLAAQEYSSESYGMYASLPAV